MRFTLEDQKAFAQLSGDHNPMHLDPVAARRTPFGRVVVHGMHLVFQLLEHLAAKEELPPLAAIEASFQQPVFLDDPVRIGPVESEGEQLKLQMVDDHRPRITLWLMPGTEVTQPLPPAPAVQAEPLAPPFADCKGMEGRFPLSVDQPRLQQRFPALAGYNDPQALAVLLGLTHLVGMVCPGLHSLFSGFRLAVDKEPASSSELHYVVKRVNSPRAPIKMVVRGGVMSGEVQAFFRPEPVEQPSASFVFSTHGHTRYQGHHALIIGGARGLGEVSAKLIAAGGGRVTITYAHGERDARRVAREITEAGGQCDVQCWDVCHPPRQVAGHYSHLYYFATPVISSGVAGGVMDAKVLARFQQFYVDGFLHTLELLAEGRSEPLQVFYPSTIYVTAPPNALAEYAMAKAAGEALCHYLHRHDQRFRILWPRLPKLHTDQNLNLLGPAPAAPLEIMPAHIEALHRNL